MDIDRAISLYEQAAEADALNIAAAALNKLARIYETGVPGVLPIDLARAVHLHNISSMLGNPSSQFTMGVLYSNGLFGVQQDDAAAMLHFYFSSLGGYTEGAMALG